MVQPKLPLRNTPLSRLTTNQLIIFGLGLAVCLLYALYTQRIWEDWFITFRSSKNLAMGNGLVYQPGERLHTFTSPLGVLIPALLSWLWGSHSDEAVIWSFRIIGAFFMGGAGILLYRIAKASFRSWSSVLLVVGLFFLDIKSIDNAINGMETAFMLFFTVLFVYAVWSEEHVKWKLSALALAGLMWTRPDAFIIAGGILAGYVLFGNKTAPQTYLNRIRKAVMTVVAGGLLYLPWLVFASVYYGSFIPNTILAKGLGASVSPLHLLKRFLAFPIRAFTDPLEYNFLGLIFSPAYSFWGGWPVYFIVFSKVLSLISVFYWLVPGGRTIGRITSLGAFMGASYLGTLVQIPYPWYIPPVTLLSIVSLAAAYDQLISLGKSRVLQYVGYAAAGVILVTQASIFAFGAYNGRLQQQLIEANRKQVGQWLKANAQLQETVFLECLGYIGFYSGLKMYDYPGLSSREVIDVRKSLIPHHNSLARIINRLHPDWLVLRNLEIGNIKKESSVLDSDYAIHKVFSVADQVRAQPSLPGKGLFLFDQTFTVFHRKTPKQQAYKAVRTNAPGDQHRSDAAFTIQD
ncbi:hypothetical protein GCM10023189_51150 [Nibrella saemangeumensis]|uniref:Glycosyltransferase RgtA/B/C/D-like domain-containing protein n=1 Tax=Nibrella saemangeumensis TaxID=1084526 RepID=A0ABP8NKS7_9BACT